jgi:pyruvate,water dikinase
MIVQGAVLTNTSFSSLTKRWFQCYYRKETRPKDKMMVYGEGGDERVKIISTEQKFVQRFCLSEDNILKLLGNDY